MIGQNNIKTGIKEAIVRTIAFFDLFNYPLTLFELWKYLGIEASYDEVEAALSDPGLRRVVSEKIGFYFPLGQEASIEARHERQALSHRKYKVAIRAAKILRFVGGLRMVAVCNNFSYRPDSDIDLFIVVEKGRLWLTRLMSAVVMQVFGLRRHGAKVADKVCLSFYVTDDNLDLSPVVFDNDPYFYYWLAWLTPVYENQNCYNDFWQANRWLAKYLPNAFFGRTGDERLVRDNYFSRHFKQLNNFWFKSAVGDALEKFCRQIQLTKMARNISSVAAADDTRVVINDRMLKFHEQDRRAEYREGMDLKIREMMDFMRCEEGKGVRGYENEEVNNETMKQKIKNTGILEYENMSNEGEEGIRESRNQEDNGEESKKTRKQENPTSLKLRGASPSVIKLYWISNLVSKLLRWGLYLFVFLLPWQTRLMLVSGVINNDYFEYGTISLYAVDILLGCLLCLALYHKSITAHFAGLGLAMEAQAEKGREAVKRYGTWLWLVIGLDLMIFISIFSSDNKFVSAYFYFKFLLGLGVFWLITNLKLDRLKLFYAFFASVFVEASFAIWQFLSQTTVANKWLGLAFHSAGEGMASVIEVAGAGRWLRAYGSFDHPNVLGAYLTLGLLLALWVVLSARYQLSKLGFIAINYILVPVVSAGLFFSFSRAAWLGLAVGVIVMLSAAVLKKDWLAQKKILRIVLVSGLVCFVMFASYEDLVTTRFANDTRLEMKSTNERLGSLSLAGEIIRTAPVFGVGAGNFANYINKYVSPDLPASSYQPVHNVFMLVAAEIGFGGLLFFVSLFVYLFLLILPSCRRVGTGCYVLGLVASLLAMMMFEHWWWSLHFGMLFFWLVLGVVFGEIDSYKVVRPRRIRLRRKSEKP